MMQTAYALSEFYNSFGIPAYMELNVPEDAERPYITYSLVETEWQQPSTHYARVWYRDEGNAAILAKVDEIKAAIGTGAKIECDDGYVVIRPGTPFAQIQIEDNDSNQQNAYNKFAYLNMQINCYHL